MRYDFFYRRQNNDTAKMFSADNVRCLTLTLTDDLSIADAITAALAGGMSKGSFQSGCFEVQTDSGIWARIDGKSITHAPHKAIFRTWEQIEHEEKSHA